MRFCGIDGPRWFVQATFQGQRALDEAAAPELDEALRLLVIDRGSTAMPVREALPLKLPPKMAEEAAARIAQRKAEGGDGSRAIIAAGDTPKPAGAPQALPATQAVGPHGRPGSRPAGDARGGAGGSKAGCKRLAAPSQELFADEIRRESDADTTPIEWLEPRQLAVGRRPPAHRRAAHRRPLALSGGRTLRRHRSGRIGLDGPTAYRGP